MVHLADSGLLVALLNRRDAHHEWARRVADRQGAESPFVTCEAVVAETAHLVSKRTYRSAGEVVGLLVRNVIRLDFELDSNVAQVDLLMRTYRDRPIDLADACLVRMSEIHPNSTVVTTDSDFHVYRRLGSQLIPTITP